ncbi:MAG TPA: CHAD domain-containing protein [Armatimonadota bacterium]
MALTHKPDDGFCLFAAETLQELLRALVQEIPGVRQAEDIEYIHRMRVASRRLRTSLTLFAEGLPGKKVAEWQKQVRRITRALGAARDTDVQIDFLQQYQQTLPEKRERVGIIRLLLRLRQQRADLQRRVLASLERLEETQIISEMEGSLRQILVRARLAQTVDRSPYLYEQAYMRVALRLEEMLAYEPYIRQPECITELHAMRIAAKRLRYTMQIFAAIYPDELQNALQAAKAVQTLLGDIHDSDVWETSLAEFLEDERKRTERYYGHARTFTRLLPGLHALREDRRQQRAQLYQEFLAYWKRLRKDNTWEALREELRAQVPEKESVAVEESIPSPTEPVQG